MGKIAKALGINVKGTATISIQQHAYHPGEVVISQINLTIREPLDSKPLVLSVVGKERLKWEKTTTTGKTKTTTRYNQKLELFSSALEIVPAQHYDPGDYVFPFRCLLPLHLSPSISFEKSSVKGMKRFRARVDYKLCVALPVHGMLRADLGSKHLINVKQIQNIKPRSAKATRSHQVELLGLFNQGVCDFTARLKSDVLRIGQAADVRCKVENQSKMRVSKVKTELYQDLTVTPLEGGGRKRQFTYTVNEAYHPGFEAGADGEAKVQPVMKTNTLFGDMLPTHNGNLFSIGYRMRVKCSYSLCPSTKVEFPMTIIG